MGTKSLVKNSIYNVLYKTLNIVFPLITSIYVARVLMADSIGKVAAAQNIVSYFTLIAAMGIPTYGVKLIAQYKIRSIESSKAFCELFLINLILSVICSICYYILLFRLSYFAGKELLYSVCGLNIIFNIFNVDWFYQGIQEYAYIAARSFVIKCISLVALILCVQEINDYISYALISSGALVGNYIFNILRIRKYIKFTLTDLHFKAHLQHIFVLFVATIAIEIYVLADTTMLDFLCDFSTVGYYTMSMRIIKIIRGLVVAISSVFLPQLSYYYFNGQRDAFLKLTNKGLHILTTLSVPAALGMFLVAEEAVTVFFGHSFINSIFTTRILSISIVTVAFSNYIGMQILVTIGKEKITTISTICGAITNIVMNYFLIRTYQHNGAAIASVITEGIVMAIQLIMTRKYIKLNFEWRKIIIASICMCVAVVCIKILLISSLTKLILECFVGVFVYGGMLVWQKDDFAIIILNTIKRHVSKLATH